MSYFSRLTDIVTCNLTQLLNESPDPHAAIAEIISEMEEGLAGAQRSVNTASSNEQRLRRDIEDHRTAVATWTSKAIEQLASGQESDARQSLMRKSEVNDLIGGLEQQHKSAVALKQHLATMQRALEARLAEAVRKREDMGVVPEVSPSALSGKFSVPNKSHANERQNQIDAELEALKRELGT